MTSNRAQVLLAMEPADLYAFVSARTHAGRDPLIAPAVIRLGSFRANRIPPHRYPELMLRWNPRLTLIQYVKAWQRAALEGARWTAASALIGTPKAPIPLTPDNAERLVELMAAWTAAEAQSSADGPDVQPTLTASRTVTTCQPHASRLAHEGTMT